MSAVFCRVAIFLLVTTPTMAHADLPLTVDDLITDKGKVKLDMSLTYVNSDQQGIATGDPITIQTGSTSFITLPTAIGEMQGNSDTLVASLGFRYGLTNKAEIYARGGYLYNSTRTTDLNGTRSDNDSRFADAWTGLNYQFKEDDDLPAVLSFFEVALREKHRESSTSFRSWMVGVTTYRAVDPIVFSLTAGYRLNQNRKDGDVDYKPGNLLLINPSVAFAVNDRVTLTTGLQWTNRQADKYDGQEQRFRRTSTDLLLGAGYGISKVSTLTLTFKTNASGQAGADLRLNWLYTF